MEISSRQQNDVTIVVVEGRIDAFTAQSFTVMLNQAIEQGKVRLVVDLSQVNYVSSAGIHAITIALREARRRAGDVTLAGAQPQVKRIFSVSGLNVVAKFFPDVDTAASSFTVES